MNKDALGLSTVGRVPFWRSYLLGTARNSSRVTPVNKKVNIHISQSVANRGEGEGERKS